MDKQKAEVTSGGLCYLVGKIPPNLLFFQHHERQCDILQYHEVERLLGDGDYGGDDLQHHPLPLRDTLRPTGSVWQKEGEAHHCQNENSLSCVTSNLSSSPVCVYIYSPVAPY